MDSNSNRSVIKYSCLESEVLLTDLYCKLNIFPDSEKTKVVTSWLANSYADLTNSSSEKSELVSCFTVHVRLFNTLANNSSFDKAFQLAECFSNDFLTTFVFPSLTETGGHFADATYYFQLACENITQPLLIRKIMRFVISQLLSTFLSRLRCEDTAVLLATLGLFKVLLEFYCEDLWYELVLQYLLPMKHFMVSDRQKALPDISYTDSTTKFLDLIPECMSEALNPEVLAENFVLYVQQELNRLNDIDSALANSTPLSKSEVTGIPLIDDLEDSQTFLPNVTITEERNPTFPLWAFKYDGTDVLHASRKYSFGEPEEYFEDDLFEYTPTLFNSQDVTQTLMASYSDSETQHEPIHDSLGKLKPIELDNSPAILIPTEDTFSGSSTEDFKEETLRIKCEDINEAYLGPLLDTLYGLLGDWTRTEPEVILMVSDVLSVLASSRIPLLSGLILDLSLVLQPYYPSFSVIAHTVKAKLDGSMQKYPCWFIKDIWQKSSSGSATFLVPEMNSQKTSPQRSLRDKFLKSSPFSVVSKLSNGSSFVKLFRSEFLLNENRILTRRASGFESEEQETMAKTMTLRCILFTHWLLELAAISQQICWSQSRKMSWT